MANAGIMHLAYARGGKPLCGNRRSHMSTTKEHLGDWGRVCVKCAAIDAAHTEKAKRRELAKATA